MATIYEWTWIGDMHVGVSPERVRIETRRGFTEYVPDRPTCKDLASEDWYFFCSACESAYSNLKPHFCPNCGAEVQE